ncbi:MAG: hypothetical protein HY698_08690 [Deltaproteobacteria bacterium]|nr:hypothetical protein [Deltaproteobacteria bacterium]
MPEKVGRARTKEEIAPDVLLVDVDMVEPKAMSFRAGQFLSLRLRSDGESRRSYSIASSPARSDGFQLVVKLVQGGGGSEFFRTLRPGDLLHFTGPMGFFTCELEHAGDAVLAVTGSGIAAALPMIEETLSRPPELEKGRVLLYWGLRRERDIYFRDRLDTLARESDRFAFHICLSQPESTWKGVNGRITQHVLTALPRLERPTFYLVGNGAMVRELKDGLVDLGVDRKKQIKTEVFYPASEP